MKHLMLILGIVVALVFVLVGTHASAAQSQSQVTLSYVVVGGGSYQPPLLTYVHNNMNVTVPLNTVPSNYSMDLSTGWYVSKVLPNSNLAQRWMIIGPSSGNAAGQSLVLVYYRQFYVTFGVPTVLQTHAAGIPTVFYTSLGNVLATQAGTSDWADYLSAYSYGNVPGLVTSSRWYVQSPTGVVQGASTTDPAYTEQYLLTFSLSSAGPDPILSTSLIRSYGGVATNQTLPAPGGTLWLDANSSFFFRTAVDSGSGSNRWFLHSVSAATASAPFSVNVVYFEQYPITVSYVIIGGTAPSGPLLTSVFNGVNSSVQMYAGSPPAWVDARSSYSISNLLSGSTSDERWITIAPNSGVASGPVGISLEFYHQVRVAFAYSVVGGGELSLFNASYSNLGVQNSVEVSTAPNEIWADYGTTLGVPRTFVGQSSVERWTLGSSTTTTLTNPQTISFVYHHQFDVAVNYTVPGGGAPIPSLSGVVAGRQFESQIPSGSVVWLDSGSFWSATPVLPGFSPGIRWIADGGANGTVGAQTSLTVTYEKQYQATLTANPADGGAVGATGWVTAGGNLRLSATPDAGWAFVRWEGNGQGAYSGRNNSVSIVVSGPVQETAYFDVGVAIHVSGTGSVSVSFGSTSYSVEGGGTLTFFVPQGTNVTLIAKPGILQTFLGWSGIPAGNKEGVVMYAGKPVGINAYFVINPVEAYGLAASLWGVAVYLIVYLAWKGRLPLRRSRRPYGRGARVLG